MAVPIFAIIASIGAYFVLSKNKIEVWETSMVVYAGILGLIYVATLAIGRLIPLDSIRLLILLSAALIPPVLSFLSRNELSIKNYNFDLEVVGIILAVILIITQIAAVPPHVLYSDKSSTVIGEGHYTESQFIASEWVNTHTELKIIPYERGLWLSQGNPVVDIRFFGSYDDDLFIRPWRSEAKANDQLYEQDAIYDSGEIKLYIVDKQFVNGTLI
ncbi:MAG: hypothetical protein U5K37_08615 [Natrialbaceae archaeon]|nr:hypothetical protein [Natrialbaceae archaeon]